MKRTTNVYLTNKELLSEIHISKMTYTTIDDPKYYMYDTIVYDLDVFMDDEVCTYHYGTWEVVYIPKPKTKDKNKKEIVEEEIPEILTEEKSNLWAFMKHKDAPHRTIISTKLLKPKTSEEFIYEVKQSKAKKYNKKTGIIPKLHADDILTGDLNIRYMTYEHIPLDENWDDEKIKKKASDGYTKLNFPPFKLYVLENGVPRCVGLSHHIDDKFNHEDGRTTEMLGQMYMKLVEKIGKKGSFRNYTYLDEMKASALVQLSQVGLLFDEGRSQNPNPFAFYTTVVTNVFKRILNNEKKVRDIRDDLIEQAGHTPSHSRQSETEWENYKERYNDNDSTLIKQRRESRNKNLT